MTFIRADVLAGADIDLLKRSGCIEVQLGIESADPRILKKHEQRGGPDHLSSGPEKTSIRRYQLFVLFYLRIPGGNRRKRRKGPGRLSKTHDRMKLDGNLACSLFPFILSPLSPYLRTCGPGSPTPLSRVHETVGPTRPWIQTGRSWNSKRPSWPWTTPAPFTAEMTRDLLSRLDPATRRAFFATRQRLTKAALAGKP